MKKIIVCIILMFMLLTYKYLAFLYNL